jgi:multicomponent Na+:H+ antiporter subunit E
MIKKFLMNLLLTFIWVALTGSFALVNFTFGLALGFFILWMLSRNSGDVRYFNRVPKMISFVFFFLYEMLRANLEVAYDVITPKYFMKPGIIKYPLSAKTDMEITMLCNLISLTPGTLILDVSDDKKVVYIHVMYVKNRDLFVRQMKEGFEKRLLEILR